MHKSAAAHLNSIIIALIIAVIIGLMIGELAWTLVIVLGCYLAWTLVHASRLHRWLYSREFQPPPESHGLWGDLLDGIHKLQKEHLRTRDRLQAMINRIQESTNALKDAVIMTDSQGAMEWWNESANRLLGFRQPADQGQLVYNLVRDPVFKRYFMSKNYQEPLLIDSPQTQRAKLQVHITLFGEEDRLVIVQDVTRLHQLEQMRRDFVSNVSHELRTPLTVLTGYLETISDHSDSLPQRWHRPLDQMHTQALRMEALVNDLLLLSKIENDGRNFSLTVLSPQALFERLRSDAQALNRDKKHHISFSVETALQIKGNRTQLESAFSNLLQNAIKYTPESGNIKVRWYETEKGAIFEVKDDGVGIDPYHIPRLTERFYRADPSRTPGTGGTGLGLAIVKHALLNHDAELKISTGVGKGSTFACHFPRHHLLEINDEEDLSVERS